MHHQIIIDINKQTIDNISRHAIVIFCNNQLIITCHVISRLFTIINQYAEHLIEFFSGLDKIMCWSK